MTPQEAQIVSKLVKWGLLGLLALFIVFSSFGIVGPQERGVRVRLGNVQGVVNPGPYLKLPWPLEKVVKMDVKTQSLIATKEQPLSAASNDLQDTKLAVVVNYHINPALAADIYRQYGSADTYYSTVVDPLIVATVKAIASQYTAADQIQKRQEMSTRAFEALQVSFEGKNVAIEKADFTDISFSESFTQAIEAKVTAVQNAEAAKNKLEQVKAEAQQKIETAKADAEAIRIQAQAITQQGGAEYVRLKTIEKWSGQGCTSYCGLEASTGLLINSR